MYIHALSALINYIKQRSTKELRKGILEVANYSFLLLIKTTARLHAKLIRSTRELSFVPTSSQYASGCTHK